MARHGQAGRAPCAFVVVLTLKRAICVLKGNGWQAHYMKDTSKPDKSDVESPFRPMPRARRSNSIDTGVLFTTVAPTPQARTKPWQDFTGIVPTA
jgi:hypothetical protein